MLFVVLLSGDVRTCARWVISCQCASVCLSNTDWRRLIRPAASAAWSWGCCTTLASILAFRRASWRADFAVDTWSPSAESAASNRPTFASFATTLEFTTGDSLSPTRLKGCALASVIAESRVATGLTVDVDHG